MSRLTDQQIIDLALDLESPRVERKAALNSPNAKAKAQRAICAFGNDLLGVRAPGLLVVGIDDAGTFVGEAVDDKVLVMLENFLHGDIHPRPSYEVRRVRGDAGECAVVIVEPYRLPPVRFNGDVWVRAGATTRKASPDEERRLAERGRAGSRTFEDTPAWQTTLADLDPILIETYLDRVVSAETRAANHRPLKHQLVAQRMLTPDGQPTHAGVLLLGLEPSRVLPMAIVQCARYPGPDLDDPVDTHTFASAMVESIEPIFALLDVWTTTPLAVSGPTHERRPLLPPRALREALVNALIHRDYEMQSPIRIRWFTDRAEIISPGGPYPPVSPSNFEDGILTAYRNPRLAEALSRLGYVERHGMGLAQIRRAMRDNGNPPPVFDAEPSSVRVTLPFGGG